MQALPVFKTRQVITMNLHAGRVGTVQPQTVTATVTDVRKNAFGGKSYMLTFTLPKLLNNKPVTVYRSLTDFELMQHKATAVKKARKPRKLAAAA